MSLTVVVLFYFTITVCPFGWVYGHTKCFLIVNSLSDANMTTAHDFCDGLDAVTMGNGGIVEPSLFFIENVEEYDLLKPHLNEPRGWINCKFVNTWTCYTDRAGTTSDYRSKLSFWWWLVFTWLLRKNVYVYQKARCLNITAAVS